MRMEPLNLLPQQTDDAPRAEKPMVRRTKTARKSATGEKAPVVVQERRKLSLTLEDCMIVIRMPVFVAPAQSASGKSMLYGSTRGPKRVMQEVDGKLEAVEFDGGKLKAIASAFVTLAAEKKQPV